MKSLIAKTLLAQPDRRKLHLLSAALTAVMLVGCSADEGGGGVGTPVPTPVPVPVPVPTPVPNGTPPTIGTLTATPATVVSGAMTTIDYAATGAVSCMRTGQWASPDAVPTSGSVQVMVPTAPGVYTYGLTCTNATGQQTSSFVNVTVLPAGSGGGGDDVTGGGDGGIVDNGDTPTDVTDGPSGPPFTGNFFCTRSARFYGDSPATTVTINGLLGDAALGGLLNLLGAGSATQLLASVSGKELAVDRSLDTFAVFNLTAGLFALPPTIPGLTGNLVSSVDLVIGLNSQVPAREYVVFGLSFPQATVELSVAQTVQISTFLGTQLQESRDVSLTAVDLLGTSAVGDGAVFAGYQTLLPYDSATISLNPALISANVGNAMNVHELCTGGRFIPTAP